MFGPDKLHTLIIFLLLTIAAIVWAVWAVGRATSKARILQAVGAISVAVVGISVTTGLQINRNLGYINAWGEIPELINSAAFSGPVKARPHAVPKWKGSEPVIAAHEGDKAWTTAFKRDSNGALKTVFKGPNSKITESVWVWVPPGYSANNGKTYRVVLMLHGFPGNPKKVPSQLDLKALTKEHSDTIFAIPSLRVPHAYGDCADIAGRPAIATWVTKDIVGMIRHNFPNTEATRQGWTIAGASFGGYCAPVLGLTNPQTFSRIIAFSGYDRPETGRLLAAGKKTKNMFTVSNLVKAQQQWPQKYYATATENDKKSVEFLKALTSVKSSNIKLTTLTDKGGGHNWGVWKKQLPAALKWNEEK